MPADDKHDASWDLVTRHKPPAAGSADYSALVTAVRQELDELDFFVRRRTAESYWRVGKFIDNHLLRQQEKADYGQNFYEQLAEDARRDKTTLSRAVQFYRAYPILAERQELNWNHYKVLITVKDAAGRKKLEEMAVRNNWKARDLQEYLRAERDFQGQDDERPVPQLKVTRGRLNIYKVAADARGRESGGILIDYGFGVLRPFPAGEDKGFEDGDLVEHVKGRYVRTDADEDQRYTYKAYVERVVDGDTLLVLIEGGAGNLLRNRLRLRGIDCPELSTGEGRKARRFVEGKLRDLPFIIIRTRKERKDIHARYLADVFYLPAPLLAGQTGADDADPAAVAREGTYLNQGLLDARLATAYP